MKKLITLVIAVALTLSFSTSALAAAEVPSSATSETTNNQVKLEGRKTDKAQKKAEIEAFRAVLKEQKVIIQANRDANKVIRLENKTLRQTIKERLQAMKDSGTTLDKQTSDQLKAYRTELKSVMSALKLTQGDIKEIRASNKGIAKELDYAAMDAAFTEITNIQAARNTELRKANEILKEIVGLVD